MKKFFGFFFIIIVNYLLLTFLVFTFSYVSLINNKTYDLLWIKYIQKNDSYRITVEKRNTSISTNEIITEVAKIFPNKVSLNKPDFIILIEILGNETGISILKNDWIFSLDKAKRMSD